MRGQESPNLRYLTQRRTDSATVPQGALPWQALTGLSVRHPSSTPAINIDGGWVMG